MGTWVTIEEQDVLNRLNKTERKTYDRAGDSDPVDDKLQGIICDVVNFARGQVRSCNRNTSIGPAGTVPPECRYHAVSLIRTALVGSVPDSAALQGDERETEESAAREYFRRVANCEVAISPDEATDPNQRTTAPVYGGSQPWVDFSFA